MDFKEYLNLSEDITTASTDNINIMQAGDSYFQSNFRVGEEQFKVLFAKKTPLEIMSLKIDDIYEIDFSGPSGHALTGANENSHIIYNKLLLTIKKFLETTPVNALEFSVANPAMNLIYHKFYQKYLSKSFLKINMTTYVKKSILKEAKPLERELLYKMILGANRDTKVVNQRIQRSKIKFREDYVKFKKSIGQIFLCKEMGSKEKPVVVLDVGNTMKQSINNVGGVEVEILTHYKPVSYMMQTGKSYSVFSTHTYSFNLYPLDDPNKANELLLAISEDKGWLSHLLKYPNFKQIYDNWLSHQPNKTNLQ